MPHVGTLAKTAAPVIHRPAPTPQSELQRATGKRARAAGSVYRHVSEDDPTPGVRSVVCPHVSEDDPTPGGEVGRLPARVR
ncbi:MAG TPA: hypothetical protein VF317_00110, partial [Dermatophilaceae bacterium]